MRLILLLLVLGAIIGGLWYFNNHKEAVDQAITQATDAKNAVVATTNEGLDQAISATLSAVAKASPIYYFNNRSYGASAVKNICSDAENKDSLGNIIAGIQEATHAVTCTVDPDFPSRSFTLTAPSRAHKGEYFCVDQSGFVGLIPNISTGGSFRLGVRCK